MKQRYLEVSYRRGKPLAAYLYLPRRADDRSGRTERHEAGLIIDYAPDGRPIGVEITAPQAVPLERLNTLLVELGQLPLAEQDYRTIRAA